MNDHIYAEKKADPTGYTAWKELFLPSKIMLEKVNEKILAKRKMSL